MKASKQESKQENGKTRSGNSANEIGNINLVGH